ncbi:glycoside hydrolase family 43 protein [Brachybacterium sp. NBEC-018]|uniref:glycoside hydrolase family 43 protein n=1 Tax=Brachybacterium sp. NBEC-018 TaxID=2996004 RepID=UPI0021751D7A|nr:glycoside hydrolase family 43 protein [Brachybacterium sp. NBEC-018]UVY84933.1 glycoside hydrolase family 43 protein [Brachybacterium sp. NBEC-018]
MSGPTAGSAAEGSAPAVPAVSAAPAVPAVPAWSEPLADPDVVRVPGGWIAYGTGPVEDGRAVPAAFSRDLVTWEGIGHVLEALAPEAGESYWAPEVCERDGAWWMYYSVGHGDRGHLIRVARAEVPQGPFRDQGLVLTPHERFAIDASPCRLPDGRWWLWFARDVLDHERPGTHLAGAELLTPTTLGPVHEVLAPYADWQVFAHGREMYGQVLDWHTLEGPHAVLAGERLLLTFSGGSWQGPGYRTAWAWATAPEGPWTVPPAGEDVLLATDAELVGPGHDSCTVGPDGTAVIAFHAWDAAGTARFMHLRELEVDPAGPGLRVGGPVGAPAGAAG